MNLENAKSILNEASRVIGLKNEDMVKLSNQYEASRESSFTAVDDIVNPVIESVVSGQPEIIASEVVSEQPAHEEGLVAPSVFDNPNSGFIPPVQAEENPVNQESFQTVSPVEVAPNANPTSVSQTFESVSSPVVEAYVQTPQAPVIEDVQGGQAMYSSSNLDTPQTFFDRVEQEETNKNAIQGEVSNSYMSEDPAILLIDNVKKVVEDKNDMIKALNEKVAILENQLRVSEEARRVAEAQRDAAHATLSQARQAESVQAQVQPQQGPTLTYQQPIYQQAA